MSTNNFILPADKVALAAKLFNDFYEALDSNGMRLFYDYDGGCWYVAPDTAEGCDSADGGALDDEALGAVIEANNLEDVEVPWFSGCGYTIRKRISESDNPS